ncbi:MAG: DUF350 domain-containing protein [Chitinivibrionales bacterium]|nr:DUF350 domain-containing protein [Chitinivibrionales bacterium]
MENLQTYLNISDAYDYVSFQALAFLALAIVLFWLGKLFNDLVTPYKINEELGSKDNKALALSYIGYLVAQGIIILGVFGGPSKAFVPDLISTGIWGLVGIVLLNFARFLNDTLVLRKFKNVKEIIEDRNVGTGAVEFGSYVGIGFVIKSIVTGESEGLQSDIIGTIIFFVAAQVAFIVFSMLYQIITKYDIHDEIEKDNAAAGVSFGLTLVAIGIIISNTIALTNSLVALAFWFVNGVVLIIASRFLVDILILPGHKLDDEISRDKNWGVALIEGGSAVVVAFLLNASFA